MPETPILICYDASDESQRAIDAAFEVLGPRKAVVLDVGSMLTFDQGVAVAAGELSGGEFEELNAEAALEVANNGADQAKSAGFDAEPRSALAADTWEGIVDTADEIDAQLIVVGSNGHKGLRGRLELTTLHDLAVHAGRPVLIVPKPEHSS